MSDNTITSTKPATGKSPTHIAYHVRDGKEGSKGFWTRCGAAWQHKDGQGLNVELEFVPLDGRIQLRVATDKK